MNSYQRLEPELLAVLTWMRTSLKKVFSQVWMESHIEKSKLESFLSWKASFSSLEAFGCG